MKTFENLIKHAKLAPGEYTEKVAANINNTKEFLLGELTRCINIYMKEDVNQEDFDIVFYDFSSSEKEEMFDVDQIKGIKLSYKGEEIDPWMVLVQFNLQEPDLMGFIYYWDEEMNEFADSEEEARKIFEKRSQNSIENCVFLTIGYQKS